MIQDKLAVFLDSAEEIHQGCPLSGAIILNLLTLELMPDVMTNQFGNYLVQRLIESAPVYALKKLVPAVAPVMVEIAVDMHGTRTIQTLVEMSGKHPAQMHNELLMMGQEMSRFGIDLALDPHGNHVV